MHGDPVAARPTERVPEVGRSEAVAVGGPEIAQQGAAGAAAASVLHDAGAALQRLIHLPDSADPPPDQHRLQTVSVLPSVTVEQAAEQQQKQKQRAERLAQLQKLVQAGQLPPQVAATVEGVLQRARASGVLPATPPAAPPPGGAAYPSAASSYRPTLVPQQQQQQPLLDMWSQMQSLLLSAATGVAPWSHLSQRTPPAQPPLQHQHEQLSTALFPRATLDQFTTPRYAGVTMQQQQQWREANPFGPSPPSGSILFGRSQQQGPGFGAHLMSDAAGTSRSGGGGGGGGAMEMPPWQQQQPRMASSPSIIDVRNPPCGATRVPQEAVPTIAEMIASGGQLDLVQAFAAGERSHTAWGGGFIGWSQSKAGASFLSVCGEMWPSGQSLT